MVGPAEPGHSGHSGHREDAKPRAPHAPGVRRENPANALKSSASSGKAQVNAPVPVSCCGRNARPQTQRRQERVSCAPGGRALSGGAEGKPASLPFPGSRVTHVPWLKAAFHHPPRRPRQAESPARPPSCFLVPASSSACEDRGRRAGHSWASGPALASPRHVARRMRPSRGPGHGRLGGRHAACGGLRLSNASPRHVPGRLRCRGQVPRPPQPTTANRAS